MDEPAPSVPQSAIPPEDRLDSWKEIAGYLDRDVTTVQRWEKREGMPVHRHLHDRMGSVYASRAELDAWVRGRNPPAAQENGNKAPSPNPPPAPPPHSAISTSRTRWSVVLPLALVGTLAGGGYFILHREPVLTERDTVVLADFTNTTGDTVFDGTQRQGLEMQLEQSPLLSLISENRVQQTLRLMTKSADARLTPDMARDLCQRVGSKAYVESSITKLGNDYVIGLKAVNCATGDSLAQEQVQVLGKEKVLDGLSQAAVRLREKLGESLSSVQKFDTPLAQATTPSLAALQALSSGRKALNNGDYPTSVISFSARYRSRPQLRAGLRRFICKLRRSRRKQPRGSERQECL